MSGYLIISSYLVNLCNLSDTKVMNLHATSRLPHLIRSDILEYTAEGPFVDMPQHSCFWEARPNSDQVYL